MKNKIKLFTFLVFFLIIINTVYSETTKFTDLPIEEGTIQDLITKYNNLEVPQGTEGSGSSATSQVGYSDLTRRSADPSVPLQSLYDMASGYQQIVNYRNQVDIVRKYVTLKPEGGLVVATTTPSKKPTAKTVPKATTSKQSEQSCTATINKGDSSYIDADCNVISLSSITDISQLLDTNYIYYDSSKNNAYPISLSLQIGYLTPKQTISFREMEQIDLTAQDYITTSSLIEGSIAAEIKNTKFTLTITKSKSVSKKASSKSAVATVPNNPEHFETYLIKQSVMPKGSTPRKLNGEPGDFDSRGCFGFMYISSSGGWQWCETRSLCQLKNHISCDSGAIISIGEGLDVNQEIPPEYKELIVKLKSAKGVEGLGILLDYFIQDGSSIKIVKGISYPEISFKKEGTEQKIILNGIPYSKETGKQQFIAKATKNPINPANTQSSKKIIVEGPGRNKILRLSNNNWEWCTTKLYTNDCNEVDFSPISVNALSSGDELTYEKLFGGLVSENTLDLGLQFLLQQLSDNCDTINYKIGDAKLSCKTDVYINLESSNPELPKEESIARDNSDNLIVTSRFFNPLKTLITA